jgi:hypothetical protein
VVPLKLDLNLLKLDLNLRPARTRRETRVGGEGADLLCSSMSQEAGSEEARSPRP